MSATALLIGKSHCIADSLVRSRRLRALYVISDFRNPGLNEQATDILIEDTKNVTVVGEYAAKVRPDFAIIGSEEPLAAGVADKLEEMGIPCVGPKKVVARLESSKAFTRELLSKYKIPGNPEYRVFRDMDGLETYLRRKESFVVKPDGLTGGKGVKVFGEHFRTIDEAVRYCEELFELKHLAVIIEERLDGEEFSFQSFYDGQHIAHMIPVQDHKRARDGDKGPNTGGMGSYSCEDHLLPFLGPDQIREAAEINQMVGEALRTETGQEYKGILYGGFMLTRDGLRVIEYNCRFGDPEVMNILSILETDFVDLCEAIVRGNLDQSMVQFRREATVCKYIVPEGYPEKAASLRGAEIDVSAVLRSNELGRRLRMYYGAVNQEGGKIKLTDSRSIAFVGIGDALAEAEKIAEKAAASVTGPVFHRRDIGTSELIRKRIEHMQRVMGHEEAIMLSRYAS